MTTTTSAANLYGNMLLSVYPPNPTGYPDFYEALVMCTHAPNASDFQYSALASDTIVQKLQNAGITNAVSKDLLAGKRLNVSSDAPMQNPIIINTLESWAFTSFLSSSVVPENSYTFTLTTQTEQYDYKWDWNKLTRGVWLDAGQYSLIAKAPTRAFTQLTASCTRLDPKAC